MPAAAALREWLGVWGADFVLAEGKRALDLRPALAAAAVVVDLAADG